MRARADCGVSDAEFWAATPGEIALLMQRRRDIELDRFRRADALNAMLCAVIANRHRSKDEQPYEPKQFSIAASQEPQQIKSTGAQAETSMRLARMMAFQMGAEMPNPFTRGIDKPPELTQP